MADVNISVLVERIQGLGTAMDSGFAAVNTRLDAVEKVLDTRLNAVNTRLDAVEKVLDTRLNAVESVLKANFVSLDTKVNAHLEEHKVKSARREWIILVLLAVLALPIWGIFLGIGPSR